MRERFLFTFDESPCQLEAGGSPAFAQSHAHSNNSLRLLNVASGWMIVERATNQMPLNPKRFHWKPLESFAVCSFVVNSFASNLQCKFYTAKPFTPRSFASRAKCKALRDSVTRFRTESD